MPGIVTKKYRYVCILYTIQQIKYLIHPHRCVYIYIHWRTLCSSLQKSALPLVFSLDSLELYRSPRYKMSQNIGFNGLLRPFLPRQISWFHHLDIKTHTGAERGALATGRGCGGALCTASVTPTPVMVVTLRSTHRKVITKRDKWLPRCPRGCPTLKD